MKNSKRFQGGISLVEVLVTVIVFAIGLLAIASLQGQLVRGSSDAKARSVGLSLVEERLEQIRSFTLDAGTTYDDIVDVPEGSAITQTVSGVEYRLWWEVDEYHFPTGASTAVLGPNAVGVSDFKMLRVHADWTDEAGVEQRVIVEDIVANAPPSDVLLTVRGAPPSEHPVVWYKDVLAAPEVIEVNLGDGFSKQTAQPEPEIVGTGPNVLTSFDTITFSNTTVDGFSIGQRLREEFLSINCRCTQDGGGTGRTPAVWNGYEWLPGRDVAKRVGVPLSGLDQPFICDRCCRDHHDVTGEERYDPFRPDTAQFYPAGLGGDHGHFIFDEVTGQLVGADGSGDEYLEACTFTRIDGTFQATSDFNLESVIVLPIEELQTSAGVTTYQTFVHDFVEAYAEQIDPATYPGTTPNFDLTDVNSTAPDSLKTTFSGFHEPVPPPATGDADGRRFLARAIYINFMNDELLNRIQCRAGSGSNCDDIGEGTGAVVPLVPFQEINVTRLATWSDAGSASIYVTNDALTATNQDSFDRGRAIHCAEYLPTDGSALVAPRCGGSNATISASMFIGNTGLLANANPIDPDDESLLSDSVLIDFGLPPEPPTRMVTGEITLQGSVKGVEISNVTVAGSSGVFCTRPEPTTFSCIFETGDSGTITFGNYNSVDRQGNVLNHAVCGAQFDNGTTSVTNLGPVGDGTATETTPYAFALLPDEEYVLDVQLRKGGC